MSTQSAMTPVPAGIYELGPATSTVSFTTRHMFGTGAVRGTFALTSATAHVAEGHSVVVDAKVAAGSFSSGVPKRDVKVVSAKLLDAARYPDIVFHSDHATPEAGRWSVQGTLTVAGQSAPLTVTVTDVERDGDSYVVTATAKVDRYTVGITAMKGLAARFLTVDISARLRAAR